MASKEGAKSIGTRERRLKLLSAKTSLDTAHSPWQQLCSVGKRKTWGKTFSFTGEMFWVLPWDRSQPTLSRNSAGRQATSSMQTSKAFGKWLKRTAFRQTKIMGNCSKIYVKLLFQIHVDCKTSILSQTCLKQVSYVFFFCLLSPL